MRSYFRLVLVAGSCGLLAACGTAPDVTGTGGAPPATQGATTHQPTGGTQGPATTPAQHASPSRRAGGASHKPGGGGGAPITIPNIIIKEGLPIYGAKSQIEAAVLAACGYRCVTVTVDATGGRCVGSYTSNPPVRWVNPEDNTSNYIVRRGTRIKLRGKPCPGSEQSASDSPSPEDSPTPVESPS